MTIWLNEKFEELVDGVLGDPEEELNFINNCSDTESESGSSTNSESGSGLGSLADYDLEDEENDNTEPMCDNEESIEGSCGSSTASKTIAKDSSVNGTDNESDCDEIQESLDKLTIAPIKEKNRVYQDITNVSPSCSKSTSELIKKKLSGKKIRCCVMFVVNTWKRI